MDDFKSQQDLFRFSMAERAAGGLLKEEEGGFRDMEGQNAPSIRSSHGGVENGREGWRVVPGELGYGLERGGEQTGAGMRGGSRRRALVAGALVSAAMLVTLVAMAGLGGQGRPSSLEEIENGIQGSTPAEEEAFFTHLNDKATDRVDQGDHKYKYWSKTEVRFMPLDPWRPPTTAIQPPNRGGSLPMFRNAGPQELRRFLTRLLPLQVRDEVVMLKRIVHELVISEFRHHVKVCATAPFPLDSGCWGVHPRNGAVPSCVCGGGGGFPRATGVLSNPLSSPQLYA